MQDHGRAGDALERSGASALEAVDTRDRPLLALARPILAAVRRRDDARRGPAGGDARAPGPVGARRGHADARPAGREPAATRRTCAPTSSARRSMFRELGDEWALGDDALVAGGDDEPDRGARRGRDRARRGDGAAGRAQRLDGAGLLRMRLSEIRVRRGDIAGARALAEESLEDARPRRPRGGDLRARDRSRGWRWLDGDLDALRRETAEAVAAARPVRAEAARAGPRAGDGRGAAGAGRDGGRRPRAARPRARGARSRPAVGTEDMPIVAMAGVVAATRRSTGRARSRRPRRRSAPPRCCGAPRISLQPGDRAAGGGSSSSGL